MSYVLELLWSAPFTKAKVDQIFLYGTSVPFNQKCHEIGGILSFILNNYNNNVKGINEKESRS